MASSFPGAIDTFDTHVDNVDDVMAADVNDLGLAVIATQTAIGSEGPPGLCEGRLTLLTGVPVTLADQAAKTSIYFTPYKGNRISLYDGTGWVTHVFTQKTLTVPSTTTTPFDIFAYSDGGTVTLEALTWTNDTTRATALTTQDGVEVKTGATTRRYLGTGRTTGVSGQIEDSLAKRFLWNRYNQVERRLYKADATGHDYNTAVWRAWNNDATLAAYFVVGLAEDALVVTATIAISRNAVDDGYPAVQIYLNASAIGTHTILNVVAAYTNRNTNAATADPRAGYNIINIYEYAFAGVNQPTFETFFLMSMIKG